MNDRDLQIALDYIFGILDTETVEIYEKDLDRLSIKYNLSHEYLKHFVEVYKLDTIYNLYKEKLEDMRGRVLKDE